MHKLSKKEVNAALKRAKALEKDEPLPMKKVTQIYEEGIKTFQKSTKLLRPEWFVMDSDAPGAKKAAKTGKKGVKRR